MKAEIITIGDEILIGQVRDTNSSFIAGELIKIGIPVRQITTVADEKESILSALLQSSVKSEIVLITGGLGPTKDDITKQTICGFFNTRLTLNQEILEQVKFLFSSRNLKMPDVNIKQAEVPEKCIPVRNKYGTAPGMWFEENPFQGKGDLTKSAEKKDTDGKKVFVFMPGVPYEMEAMMTNEILPKLKKKFNTPYIVQKTILTQGVGESMLMELIENWEEDLYSKGIKLAYLPSFGSVRLRLTLSGYNKSLLEETINAKTIELKRIIPDFFSGEEGEKPEEIVGQLLREKKMTLSTAESCTGGFLAHLITSISGSSDYYTGSVVSYSNKVKSEELNVDEEVLKKNGAVSREVVEQMAAGARKKFSTDFAVSTSGIAGPSGGTEEKPVGTVWIAVAGPKGIISKKFLFGKSRERNIRQTAGMALNLLRAEILKN